MHQFISAFAQRFARITGRFGHRSLVFLFCLWAASAQAQQNVGIGTTTPDSKAALDISATDKGLLVPRLTQAQRTAITSPPDGLMVFQTDGTTGFWYYFGGAWVNIPNANTAGDNLGNHTATTNLNLASNKLVGNGGTTGISISNAGNVGINQTAPSFQLHVGGTFRSNLTNGTFSLYNNTIGSGTVLLGALDGTGGAGAQLRFSGAGGVFMDVGQNSSGNFVVEGNDVARLTVLNAGNVGIGTTSPTATLEVAGGSSTVKLGGLAGTGTRVVTADASGNLATVTTASLADNLGNHTATQDLDLGLNKLVGQGGSNGLYINSAGTVFTDGQLSLGGNINLGPNRLTGQGGALGVTLANDGTTTVETLTGTGTRMVTANSLGELSTQAIPVDTDTDAQALSISGSIISLTNGGSVTVPSSADNLGNHTATQALDLSTFKLVGNGGTTGLSIANGGGVTSDNGLSINNGGLTVSNGGAIISNGGMLVNGGGIAISSGGLAVTADGAAITGTTSLNASGSAATSIGTGASAGAVTIGRASGTVTLGNLTGTGTRMVTADASGNLSTATVPTGESTTAANGLTLSGTAVQLGGALTSATTIGTTATNTLTVNGAGTVNVGTGTGAVNVGNSSALTTLIGSNMALTGGDFININANVAVATNINDGTSTGVANIGTGQGLVNVGNTNAATTIKGSGITLTGTTSINTSGSANTSIGTGASAGAVTIGRASGIVTMGNLAGSGTRVVTADGSGNLSTVTTASLADNLGNHTATQKLDLSTFKLVGNGGTTGLGISSGGAITADGALTTGGAITAGGKVDLGANQLVGNGGTNGLGITSGGQVGLGGITPSLGQLSNTTTNILASDGNGVNFSSGVGSLTWAMTTNGYVGAFYNGSSLANGHGLAVKINGTNASASLLDLSTGTSQGTAGTSRLVVKADGKVGIGASSPSSTLQVSGTTAFTPTNGIVGGASGSPVALSSTTSTYLGLSPGGSSQQYYQLPDPSTCTGRMYVIRNNSGSNTAILSTAGGALYNGSGSGSFATYTLNTNAAGKTVILFSDGSNWTIGQLN